MEAVANAPWIPACAGMTEYGARRAPYSVTFTPFQKATRSLIISASGFGSA